MSAGGGGRMRRDERLREVFAIVLAGAQPGMAMPSTRAIGSRLGVNQKTIIADLRQLAALGAIKHVTGQGVRSQISVLMSAAEAAAAIADFASGGAVPGPRQPPIGQLPVLQYLPPAALQVDAAYQRDIAGKEARSLIAAIADHWNWGLCLPLVVSRRRDEGGAEQFFIIDGQHRHAAASLRGDIHQLPCVVLDLPDVATEAASFSDLNRRRRALSSVDVFRADVASGEPVALAIAQALADAGLALAPHGNPTAWKPEHVNNIGGIRSAWKRCGADAVRAALRMLSAGFDGEVKRYAGTIFPGLAALADDKKFRAEPDAEARMIAALERSGQEHVRSTIMAMQADNPGLGAIAAARIVLREMFWPELADKRRAMKAAAARVFRPPDGTTRALRADAFAVAPGDRFQGAEAAPTAWCSQCERRVNADRAAACTSRFCALKVAR